MQRQAPWTLRRESDDDFAQMSPRCQICERVSRRRQAFEDAVDHRIDRVSLDKRQIAFEVASASNEDALHTDPP
jgi:hypothetical protein